MSKKCHVKRDNNFPSLNTLLKQPRILCSLCSQGTLLTYAQDAIQQNPQIPFHRTLLKIVLLQGILSLQVQNLAFLEFHEVSVVLFLQSIQVSSKQQIYFYQLVLFNLVLPANMPSEPCHLLWFIGKDIKRTGPRSGPYTPFPLPSLTIILWG